MGVRHGSWPSIFCFVTFQLALNERTDVCGHETMAHENKNGGNVEWCHCPFLNEFSWYLALEA